MSNTVLAIEIMWVFFPYLCPNSKPLIYGLYTSENMSILQHSEFHNGGSYPNDIALIRLDTPVTFSAAVQPIYVPSEGSSFLSTECWITGWGETRSQWYKLFAIIIDCRIIKFGTDIIASVASPNDNIQAYIREKIQSKQAVKCDVLSQTFLRPNLDTAIFDPFITTYNLQVGLLCQGVMER